MFSVTPWLVLFSSAKVAADGFGGEAGAVAHFAVVVGLGGVLQSAQGGGRADQTQPASGGFPHDRTAIAVERLDDGTNSPFGAEASQTYRGVGASLFIARTQLLQNRVDLSLGAADRHRGHDLGNGRNRGSGRRGHGQRRGACGGGDAGE